MKSKWASSTIKVVLLFSVFSLMIPGYAIPSAFAPSCIAPPPGLVSWWPLDETTGNTSEDIQGDNDGTHVGSPGFVGGKVAGGLFFDGANDYVKAGNDNSLDITGEITIDAWINPNTINKFQDIVVKGNLQNDPLDITYFLLIMTETPSNPVADGTIRFGINDGAGANHVDSSVPIAAGVWTHVAVTFDPVTTNDVIIYINGVAQGTGKITSTPPSNSDELFIGALQNNGGIVNEFSGTIDEVEIFDRVLSQAEIQAIVIHDKCKESSPTEVEIDIKPGSFPSSVNCKNLKGNVPVAIFGSDTFDVIEIEIVSMVLVSSSPIPVTLVHDNFHIDDLNGDEFDDAVLHLDKAGVCGATSGVPLKQTVEVELTGETTDGTQFVGIGDIRIVKR